LVLGGHASRPEPRHLIIHRLLNREQRLGFGEEIVGKEFCLACELVQATRQLHQMVAGREAVHPDLRKGESNHLRGVINGGKFTDQPRKSLEATFADLLQLGDLRHRGIGEIVAQRPEHLGQGILNLRPGHILE
jgi:hypothetical protein